MAQLFTFVLNHWTLWLALIVIMGVLIKMELANTVRGITLLSPQQVVDAMNRESALVMDVRNSQAFAKGHILGAINIAKDELSEQNARLEPHKAKPVIVTDNNGQQLINTATKLRKLGFSNVRALRGGMVAWQNANLPLAK